MCWNKFLEDSLPEDNKALYVILSNGTVTAAVASRGVLIMYDVTNENFVIDINKLKWWCYAPEESSNE